MITLSQLHGRLADRLALLFALTSLIHQRCVDRFVPVHPPADGEDERQPDRDGDAGWPVEEGAILLHQ